MIEREQPDLEKLPLGEAVRQPSLDVFSTIIESILPDTANPDPLEAGIKILDALVKERRDLYEKQASGQFSHLDQLRIVSMLPIIEGIKNKAAGTVYEDRVKTTLQKLGRTINPNSINHAS